MLYSIKPAFEYILNLNCAIIDLQYFSYITIIVSISFNLHNLIYLYLLDFFNSVSNIFSYFHLVNFNQEIDYYLYIECIIFEIMVSIQYLKIHFVISLGLLFSHHLQNV